MTRREFFRHAVNYLLGAALIGLARLVESIPSREWSE